jgi:hypothetical protein
MGFSSSNTIFDQQAKDSSMDFGQMLVAITIIDDAFG